MILQYFLNYIPFCDNFSTLKPVVKLILPNRIWLSAPSFITQINFGKKSPSDLYVFNRIVQKSLYLFINTLTDVFW